jgi:hypothetical protein
MLAGGYMKKAGRYLGIMIVLIVFWNSVIIKPLKIFAVFLHELGHSLMSVIFGYGIQGIRINLDESGYAITLPKDSFSAFMIANGGYLGSVFFALLILQLKRTKFKKYLLGSIAIILLIVSLRYGDSVFTILYSATFVAFVLLLYMMRNEKLNDWVIDIIGISSAVYAVYDTFVDTILLQLNIHFNIIPGWKTAQPMTDAVQLQNMTGIPAIIWGVTWLMISLAAIYSVVIKGSASRRRRY